MEHLTSVSGSKTAFQTPFLSFSVNSLQNKKISGLFKLKEIQDNIKYVAEIVALIAERIENIVGKWENAGYQHFLFCPKCFQRTFLLCCLKSGFYSKGYF